MAKRIGVLGAGGIGGTISACLAHAGYDITIIDQWPAHVDKIKRDGLSFIDLEKEFIVKVPALHLCEAINMKEGFDAAFLSVKSYDTVWAAHFLSRFLKPDGFILPAQNGLNDETVAGVVGAQRTVGCVVVISAGCYEPGRVVRTDPVTMHSFTVGELDGKVTPRAREMVDALKKVGPSEVTSNIKGARWSKMVVNCMYNALAGLLGPNTSGMTPEQQATRLRVSATLGGEVVRVALSQGIEVETPYEITPQEFVRTNTLAGIKVVTDKLEAAARQRGNAAEQLKRLGQPARPSLLQDVIKGRRSEVEFLNGVIVKKGAECGVMTPLNAALTDLMRQVDSGALKPDPANLKRLEPFLPKK